MITAAFDRRFLAATFAAAVATTAHAEVVVDNLGEPVRHPAPLHETFWYAQSFLTAAAASPSWLDEVTLRLGVRVGDPAVVAQLLADAGDSPGTTVLTSFIVPTITPGTATNTTLTPVDEVQLQPGTQYWVLMGVTGAGGYDWDYAEGNGQTGSGSFWTYAYTEDLAATWTGFGNQDPLMMRVDVTPVPEPAPALLLAGGLAALYLRRRRG